MMTLDKKNLKEYVLYTYDISKLDSSKKVRFVYLLKGRRKQVGIINEFKGEFLVPGCFILPIAKDSEIQEIFKMWDIKNYTREVILK